MPKKSARKFGTFWKCEHCKEKPEFEHEGMMDHLRTVHGIDTKKATGQREMIVHLDGDDWFSSSYEWRIGDILATQLIVTKRTRKTSFGWR